MSLQNTIFGLQVGMSPIIADDDKVPRVITDADAKAIQNTILTQINHLQNHDCAAALEQAAPHVNELFKNPDDLLTIVFQFYPMIYFAHTIEFGDLELTPEGIGQLVKFIDRENDVEHALYVLERQLSGSWKIGGCMSLGKNPEKRPQLPFA